MILSVNEHNDGGQISAQVGDTIEIRLAENATTGYRWELDGLDPHFFKLEQATGDYQTGSVGSGGDAVFRIKVHAAGTSTLSLKNWRRWEKEAGVIKRFNVRVNAS